MEAASVMPALSGSCARRGKHSNTGAVAGRFEKCETKRILLGAEHPADQAFPILRHPITAPVFNDFEVMRREYRPRLEGRHRPSVSLLHVSSFERIDSFSIAVSFREPLERFSVNSSYRSRARAAYHAGSTRH